MRKEWNKSKALNSNEKLNLRIAAWLGACPHSNVTVGGEGMHNCDDCGEEEIDYEPPQYHTEAGFFLLLAGLEAKGWWFDVGKTLADKGEYFAYIYRRDEPNSQQAWADSLPLALCSVTEKLMEAQDGK